jgi:RimJ/RimL family protein N-acetyltransferase
MKTTRPIFPQPAKAFETDRLLLRSITVEDVAEFHKLRTQPDVMINTSSGKVDADLDATLKWTQRFVTPNDANTFSFAVEELSNPGAIIGTVGCHQSEPPELGYMYRREYWGKGYSTEALKAWLQQYWALERKEVDLTEAMPEYQLSKDGADVRERLSAMFAEHNKASSNVLTKCGFVASGKQEEEEDFRGHALLIWYHLERPA